jgi:hypothetical protein
MPALILLVPVVWVCIGAALKQMEEGEKEKHRQLAETRDADKKAAARRRGKDSDESRHRRGQRHQREDSHGSRDGNGVAGPPHHGAISWSQVLMGMSRPEAQQMIHDIAAKEGISPETVAQQIRECVLYEQQQLQQQQQPITIFGLEIIPEEDEEEQ